MTQLAAFPEDWQRGLAVVAHPDDIEYGLASAIARWTAQGKTISYLLATRGEAGIDSVHPDLAAPLREQEERTGAARVGVAEVDFLDHRDGVVEYSTALRRDIARVIRQRRPEVVFTGDFAVRFVNGMTNQPDHRAVGLATLDAARDAGNRWIHPELTEEGVQPWPGVRYVALVGSSTPTHGVDVTGEPLQRGIASLEAHSQYTSGLGAAGFAPAPFLDLDGRGERTSPGGRGGRPPRRTRPHPRRSATLGLSTDRAGDGDLRIGIGYDIHRLVPGHPLVLGGVSVEAAAGFDTHSDGDVLAHALVDALAGALADGDLGTHFPEDDPEAEHACSLDFVIEFGRRIRARGFEVTSLDSFVVLGPVRLRPYLDAMRTRLAGALEIDPDRVSVKARSNDGLGLEGRGEAASAQVAVLLRRTGG